MHETATRIVFFWKKRAPARQTPGVVAELGFTKIHTFTENLFFQVWFPEKIKTKNIASKSLNTLSVTIFTFSFKKNWFCEDLPKNEKIQKSKYK